VPAPPTIISIRTTLLRSAKDCAALVRTPAPAGLPEEGLGRLSPAVDADRSSGRRRWRRRFFIRGRLVCVIQFSQKHALAPRRADQPHGNSDQAKGDIAFPDRRRHSLPENIRIWLSASSGRRHRPVPSGATVFACVRRSAASDLPTFALASASQRLCSCRPYGKLIHIRRKVGYAPMCTGTERKNF
jgi:hypothetical protein